MLKLEELEVGYLYQLDARRATVGIWTEDGEFLVSRWKCGENFLFVEVHADLSKDFGTAMAIKEIEKAPFNMDEFVYSFDKNHEVLKYLNNFEKEPLWIERRKVK